MPSEPYEILPYRELASLKKEIADLKQKIGDGSSKQLSASMENLTKKMDNMLNLFQAAAEDMNTEQPSSDIAGKLDEINDKLNSLLEENKTIAEGIVALADMIREEKPEELPEPHEPIMHHEPLMPEPMHYPEPGHFPNTPLPGPPPMSAHRPEPIPTPLGPFPPPGPSPEKPKKGLFRR